jgi:uncharacterized protein
MSSTVSKLQEVDLAHPPKFLSDNMQYETIMGSIAYGVGTDESDWDIYGFCIPPKEDIFPHLRGEIIGFGTQKNRFEQYQEQHLVWKEREYDLSIYSIVKYFQLLMENNPNMVDSLFTPTNCVLHITHTGQLVRDNRKLFLHKGAYHKFRGYAYSQLSKIVDKKRTEGNRKPLIEKYGYDVKFAYHIIRLMDECEQILSEGDLDLQRSRVVMKSIRNGEWTEDQVREYFSSHEKQLEELYHSSKLPYGPDEDAIKQLLLACLEEHYGSLSGVVTRPGRDRDALEKIASIITATLYK